MTARMRYSVAATILAFGLSIAAGAFFRRPPGPEFARNLGTLIFIFRTPPKPCLNEITERCDQPTLDCLVRRNEDLLSEDHDSQIVVACTCKELVR